jgi:helix-turn-helix protein/DnaA-like protein
MAKNTELSHSAFRVACIIGAHFNHNTGSTFISLPKIARMAGICRNTARKLICELEQRGYLIVERPVRNGEDGQSFYGGRGATNVYRPSFPQPSGGVGPSERERQGSERDQSCAPFPAEKGVNAETLVQRKRGQPETAKRSSARAPVPLLTQETRARGGGDWTEVQRRLQEVIGHIEFRCWFRDIWVDHEGTRVITLGTTGKFTKREVEARYGAALLRCWQSLHPSIERVQIGLRPKNPTGAP